MSKKERRAEALENAEIKEEVKEVEVKHPIPGMLFSRLDYPEEAIYDGQTIIVTPKARLPLADYNKLDLNSLKPGLSARALK